MTATIGITTSVSKTSVIDNPSAANLLHCSGTLIRESWPGPSCVIASSKRAHARALYNVPSCVTMLPAGVPTPQMACTSVLLVDDLPEEGAMNPEAPERVCGWTISSVIEYMVVVGTYDLSPPLARI